jgi:hypothetical protein
VSSARAIQLLLNASLMFARASPLHGPSVCALNQRAIARMEAGV